MNRKICKGCRRYIEHPGDPDKWYCAKKLFAVKSKVIPGYALWTRDELYTYCEEMLPPEWCDFAAEQMVVDSEDEIDVVKAKRVFRINDGKS